MKYNNFKLILASKLKKDVSLYCGVGYESNQRSSDP
jgi:hypothetical protein